jgi:outer membrane protein assembly factor BamE (lipoprotein component of BamABCDE complex)
MNKAFKGQKGFGAGILTGLTILFFAIVAIVLPGCTTQEGRPISDQSVLSLKVGKTTEKDVLARFGPPEEKSKLLGEEIWTYRHIVHEGFVSVTTSRHTLRIRFDENGVIRNIEQRRRKKQQLF